MNSLGYTVKQNKGCW